MVADRWAYGYLVQPAALKFYGPVWLARMVLRLLPEADLVAQRLSAPEEVIRDANKQLTLQEISAELTAWGCSPCSQSAIVRRTGPTG